MSNSFARDRGSAPGAERLLDPAADADVVDLVRRTAYHNIDLIPSNPLLARFDPSDQRAWEASDLQHAFDPVGTLRGLYDLIVFDCPPRLSLVSFAALRASDGVIVPLEAADWGRKASSRSRLRSTTSAPATTGARGCLAISCLASRPAGRTSRAISRSSDLTSGHKP